MSFDSFLWSNHYIFRYFSDKFITTCGMHGFVQRQPGLSRNCDNQCKWYEDNPHDSRYGHFPFAWKRLWTPCLISFRIWLKEYQEKSGLHTRTIIKVQFSTFNCTKPNNKDHPTIGTRQVWPFGWFQRWFYILYSFYLK